jgi:hypothetical protein
MENKLDKIFRNKLENHAMEPSAQAWEKVRVGIPTKNNTIGWAWRIAAAVTLMGVISMLVIGPWKGEGSSTLANQTTESTQKKIKEVTPSETRKEDVTTKKTEVPAKIESDKLIKPNKTVSPKNTRAPKLYNSPLEQPVAETNQETIKLDNQAVAINTIEPIQTETQNLPAVTDKASAEKTLVIVYTLAPVEGKPAAEPTKIKPLQRMLTFAKDVKGGETTLASVRNWKDSFLGTEETARMERQKNNN